MEKDTIVFIVFGIIMFAGFGLMVTAPHSVGTNPYAKYICHGNITNINTTTSDCYNNPAYTNWNNNPSLQAIVGFNLLIGGVVGLFVTIFYLNY